MNISSSNESRAWLVLSFSQDRQHAGNLGYKEDPTKVYRYDSFVANHKRVHPGDLLVIRERSDLVGFARIKEIRHEAGIKQFLRCPKCGTTGIKKRNTNRVPYRCHKGHEFEEPVLENMQCTLYDARYDGAFVRAETQIAAPVLRSACYKYADQLAIQSLDFSRIERAALDAAPGLRHLLETGVGIEREILLERVRLTREHVLAAVSTMSADGYSLRNRARLFELVEQGKKYPVKYTVSLALRTAAGKSALGRASRITETSASRLLTRLGFKVEEIGTTFTVMEELIKNDETSIPEWDFDAADLQDAREKVAKEISMRRGQPTFRGNLLKVYAGRCAISGCDTVEVLEACHIIPYLGPQTNHPCNGLLLRADLHTLFDIGLLTIQPITMTVQVAAQLRQTDYAVFDGKKLRIPENPAFAPSVKAIEEHLRRSSIR